MNSTELSSILTRAFGLQNQNPMVTAAAAQGEESLRCLRTPSGTFAQVGAFRQTIIPNQASPQPQQVLFKLVTQGDIHIKSRTGEHALSSGTLALLAWNPQFEETFSTPSSLFVIGCDRGLCQRILPLLGKNGGISTQLEPQDVQYLTGLITQYIHQADNISPTLSIMNSQMIITTLGELLLNSQQTHTARLTSKLHNIAAIKRFIATNLHDPALDAETIAEHVRLSVNYMNRLLAEENLSLMKLVWQQRLEEAQRLLLKPATQHLQLAEIAWLCGFSSQSHFSQVFKKKYGLTPRAMRAANPH